MLADFAALSTDDTVAAALRASADEAISSGDTEAIRRAVHALRDHITETYRLNQRLLRTRRRDVEGWEIPQRSAVLSCDVDADGRVVDAWELLEDWRAQAISRLASMQQHDRDADFERRCSVMFASLVEALGAGVDPFLKALLDAPRADPELDRRVDSDGGLKDRARRVAEGGDPVARARGSARMIDQALRELETEHGSGARVVAFSSDPSLVDAIPTELSRLRGFGVVHPATRRMSPDEIQTSINRFWSATAPAVLLCDRAGEEGLNLQGCHGIVHLDLPLDPLRIEQRIGRLDRIGRASGAIRQWIQLPSIEPASPWQQWLELLKVGFSLFDRTIADVQFVLDGILDEALRDLLRMRLGEADAGHRLATALSEERRRLDEQFALDRLEMGESDAHHLFERLTEAEAADRKFAKAMSGWWEKVLRLDRYVPDDSAGDRFVLRWRDSTLAPREPWEDEIERALDVPLTYDRRVALDHAGTRLVRSGNPLVEVLPRFLRYDDRGTAFATWRTDPRLPDSVQGEWVGFRLTYAVELDADALVSALSDVPGVSLGGVRRRADLLFAPWVETVFVDSSLELVTDPDLVKVLKRPYQTAGPYPGAGDTNLADARSALSGVLEPRHFAELCAAIKGRRFELVEGRPEYQERLAEARLRARTELSVRAERLERRAAAQRREFGAGDMTSGAETAVIQAITEALAGQLARLDSVGLMILSRMRPRVWGPVVVGRSGYEALRQVEAALCGRRADPDVAEYAFGQLIRAAQAKAAPVDLAVLLRTGLRYWNETGNDDGIAVCPELLPDTATLSAIGVHLRRLGADHVSYAKPWRPEWLPCAPGTSVDGDAAREAPRRSFPPVPGDPFLQRVHLPGHDDRPAYKSIAQRGAIRAALDAPPGSVLAICLGTGEGKSLAFQLASEVGFGDPADRPGVTLVITPTIALAIDHENAAAAVGLPNKPRAYIGDGPADRKDQIQQAIEEGSQGLVFTSPEAAGGSLRPSLERAASLGQLRCFVVDEAHLVEAWGEEFRPDFQLLGGLRNGLLRMCSGEPFRTLLLSATLAESTIETLRTLFCQEETGVTGPLAIVGAASLRSEIDYWVSPPCAEDERRRRVVDTLMHAPRPAIVYTTRREDAATWYQEALLLGFRRVALFTGITPEDERREVISRWRAGELDLVVATSAFGLGIDHRKVRTVVHACVPETLDRFYQEVGRGGRDGNASLSVLIPSWHDLDIAKQMSHRKLIGITLGRQRWEAMFRHPDRVFLGKNDWMIRVDVAPGRGRGRHDMVNERSIGWNVKTLTLMAGAGLLALEDATVRAPANDDEARDSEDWHQFQRVRILEPDHVSGDVWSERVEPYRKAARAAADRSLRLLMDYVHSKSCIGNLLAAQYHVRAGCVAQGTTVEVAATCPGCPVCRGSIQTPTVAGPLPWPWPPSGRKPLHEFVDGSRRLLVLYEGDLLPEEGRPRRRRLDCLSRIMRAGIRNLIAPPKEAAEIQKHVPTWPLFADSDLLAPDLPPGPTAYLIGPGGVLSGSLLAAPDNAEVHQPRIFVLPIDTPDPYRPGSLLTERYPGRRLGLTELCEAVTA